VTYKNEHIWTRFEVFTALKIQVLHPEDGGLKVLRNVGVLPQHYAMSQPKDLDLNLYCLKCAYYNFVYWWS